MYCLFDSNIHHTPGLPIVGYHWFFFSHTKFLNAPRMFYACEGLAHEWSIWEKVVLRVCGSFLSCHLGKNMSLLSEICLLVNLKQTEYLSIGSSISTLHWGTTAAWSYPPAQTMVDYAMTLNLDKATWHVYVQIRLCNWIKSIWKSSDSVQL